MKKIIILIMTVLLIGCTEKINTTDNKYELEIIKKLSDINSTLNFMNGRIDNILETMNIEYEKPPHNTNLIMPFKTPCYVWTSIGGINDTYKNQNIREYSHTVNGENYFFVRDQSDGDTGYWTDYKIISNYKLISNK